MDAEEVNARESKDMRSSKDGGWKGASSAITADDSSGDIGRDLAGGGDQCCLVVTLAIVSSSVSLSTSGVGGGRDSGEDADGRVAKLFMLDIDMGRDEAGVRRWLFTSV
ncbi:hypothetical protein GGI07_005103 [Coemansia sp. Benny D115]|nr:hypothetical protein GGI07_005103 [Coemansia sp. Benny D115]